MKDIHNSMRQLFLYYKISFADSFVNHVQISVWTVRTEVLAKKRAFHSMVAINDKAFVFGGRTCDEYLWWHYGEF